MKRKIKYTYFHIKECSDLYAYRTYNPYKHPNWGKYTVLVRKVLCNYRKIITKTCRVNDIQKFINTDSLFPMNSAEYINLLIEVTENATNFFNSLSLMSGNNHCLRKLRLAYHPIQENYNTIQTMLYNELDGSYSSAIRIHAKTLKLNLVSCIEILDDISNFSEDWMASEVVLDDLETYIINLRTICSFIYLIILKKKSTVVNKMLLPPVSYSNSKYYKICSICGQIEADCKCCTDLEGDKNDDIENKPHCSKSAGHDEVEDADFWHRYLENYGYDDKKSKRDSQESSSDSD